MKSLRDYQLNLGTSRGSEGSEREGITWGPAYHPPIHAEVNGLPVRVLNIGDLPGASTICLCTDATGFLAEVKRTDVTVTDGAYLPLKAELVHQSMR